MKRELNHRFAWVVPRFKEERGNVESALVIVPLILLFLSAMQILVTIQTRNGDQIQIQGEASVRAISGELTNSDEIISISRGGVSPDLLMVTSHMRRSIPTFLPGLDQILGKTLESEVAGIAVIEESR